jgi:DNA primase
MIEPADDWEEAVAQTIKNAGCLVALLTENAAQSEWVRRELGFAEANQTRIFPLLLRGNSQETIPLRLITHQFIDARQDYEDAMRRLIGVIREHLKILDDAEDE